MNRTRVKICGLTRPDDARVAVDLGADAIGLVFAEKSPRTLTASDAAEVAESVQGLVWRVGLFMNPSEEQVRDVMDHVALDGLQFHGTEDPAFCAGFGLPWIKAVPLQETESTGWSERWEAARALIVDSHAPGRSGGTGTVFDWTRFPSDSVRPLMLAGGLKPDNVRQAIETVRPWGVDVSSGVESAPGQKDAERMKQFFDEVMRADCCS